MGVLLVAGFIVLVVGFLQLVASPSEQEPAIVALSLDALDLPSSARLLSVTAIDNRLIVLVEGLDGEQSLLMVDPRLLRDAAVEE